MNLSIFPSLKFKSSRGFTLLELLVSIGLFLIAVFIGIGAIASMFSANNKSQSLVSVIGNLNYSIEGMVRNIKYATTYHCGSSGTLTLPSDCINGGSTSIAITNSLGTTMYSLISSEIQISTDLGLTWKPITGGEMTIQDLKFYVGNSTKGDSFQPYVLITMHGYAKGKLSDQSYFDLQTIVSARALDI